MLHFFRAGGLDQARLDSGQDLTNIHTLDQKLWVALACPTRGLSLDARTLELVDADKDGRIRAPELLAAVSWAAPLVKNADDFVRGEDQLPLAAINTDNDTGKNIHTAALTVLRSLGKVDAGVLTVAESADALRAFNAMPKNGDGVLTVDCVDSPAAKKLVEDIVATLGGVEDRSGKLGVSAEKCAAFFTEVNEHLAWRALNDGVAAKLRIQGDVASAFAALTAVRTKIDDFFARCRLAAFDPRSAAALNGEHKDYAPLAAGDVRLDAAEIRALPLSRIEGGRALPLKQGMNPAWATELAAFVTAVVVPLLGAKDALSEGDWAEIVEHFRPWQEAQASKRGAVVEVLGVERLRAVAAEPALLEPFFAEDKARAPIAEATAALERLARYRRDLFTLANNFVSFRDFYERKKAAIFQIGTLYLDQRACELCIRVEDAAKHATMSPFSRAYLAYCDCVRPATGEKMSIVAAFTAGDGDNLLVGRNGIFYDREGKDWDATITRIVDNPISVRQAFFSPYKKAMRFVEEQVAKRAAESDKSADAAMKEHITTAATVATTGAPAPVPKKLDIGVVAALGVAVGGITAALSGLLQAFFGLGFWMPLGVVALLLAISGPSMLIAWLKLRQRNLAPLLDANGWAVNANARINIPLGRSLTAVGVLPKGAKVDTNDPFHEARRPWRLYILLLIVVSIVVAWAFGGLEHLLPERLKRGTYFAAPADPAATQPAR